MNISKNISAVVSLPVISHHGAVDGVTGSCHRLTINPNFSLLIDCGSFQGAETSGKADANSPHIDFEIDSVAALIVTHCHIDHVGRIPWLVAAGFRKPIYCTPATAHLLPLVLEDAIKLGITKDKRLVESFLKVINSLIAPVEYKTWFSLPLGENAKNGEKVKFKFQPAGHILGSAYVEIDCHKHRFVFSGDLGAPYTPLLPSPKAPYKADTLVIESTYGDKNHIGRKQRRAQLKSVVERCLENNGAVLIPAFSIGRTQELLYEIEDIIYRSANNSTWQDLTIILDSPMAADFTAHYKKLSALWDKEAKRKLKQGRHPLDFDNLYTIDDHQQHLDAIEYIRRKGSPCIVIAASGMCSGGRIMNYLQALLPDSRTDVVFVGYQAKGTPGRDIQKYGPRGGYVVLDGQRVDIKAGVYTLSGYSAHADQSDLINFVKRMRYKPGHIKIVHGDDEAKVALQAKYQALLPECFVEIAG
ncbi:MBL fold metallo-hydrolase RNA specificity domain-containing protein [Catenovulum agarivorans]|uniref:MBL fold metallo-hydrolase RNA specificity domain-containing protein n=1 Tax=Catenovulum agarivorans TaxID=1172192 RepID=UPI0002E9F65A|nr:MBL fold metallo-hydrolase [Catenovulum agarivorans]